VVKKIILRTNYILFNKVIALLLLVLTFPIIIFLFFFIGINSEGPSIFRQKRIGHGMKEFTIYKFRTMVANAEELRDKYDHLNYADGPVFKIDNDPRFTNFGRFLSRSHLDELPQIFNVLKGDMMIVGFRPPTYNELLKYKKWQKKRFEGWPGITSIWASSGGHSKFKFDEWIESDIDYESVRGFRSDIKIMVKTVKGIIKKLSS